MDNYYLKSEIIYKNDRRFIVGYKLYNNDKVIREFTKDESKSITHNIKEYNIKYKEESNYIIVDNIDFLKAFSLIPSKKVSHTNKYTKVNVLIASTVLSFLLGAMSAKALEGGNNTPNTVTEITEEDYTLFDTVEPTTLTTTEEKTTENVTTENVTTENVTTENVIEEIKDIDTNNNTFEYDYSDFENRLFIENIEEKYGDSIKKYSEMYGIDEKLIAAIIAQENPRFSSGGPAAGLMQLEKSAWDGVTVIDIDGSELYIDCNLIDDIENYSDYGIHVGCYVFWYTYNKVNEDNENGYFNYKLTDAEVLGISLSSYNKSVFSVEPCLYYTNSFYETDQEIENISWGDEHYRDKVLSGLEDGCTLTMTTRNGEKKYITIDNLYENSFKK